MLRSYFSDRVLSEGWWVGLLSSHPLHLISCQVKKNPFLSTRKSPFSGTHTPAGRCRSQTWGSQCCASNPCIWETDVESDSFILEEYLFRTQNSFPSPGVGGGFSMFGKKEVSFDSSATGVAWVCSEWFLLSFPPTTNSLLYSYYFYNNAVTS